MLSDASIDAAFAVIVRRAPASVAIVTHERAVTFAELDVLSRTTARLLSAAGVRGGDRVVVSLPTSLEHAQAVLALLRMGAVVVPAHPAATPDELRYVLDHAQVRHALVADGHADVVAELEVTRVDVRAAASVEPLALREHGDADATALVVYTSGTTGRPKGVCLPHRAIVRNVRALAEIWGWSAEDRLMLTLPTFHVHGLVLGVIAPWILGSSVVLRERFVADEVPRDLAASRATMFFGVPTMYARLAALEPAAIAGVDLSHVRRFVSGSAPLPAAVAVRFSARWGHAIVERFGMSEGLFMLSTRPGAERPGSVGTPVPGVDARVVVVEDGRVRDARDGELGELWVRGDSLFTGYLRDASSTERAFRDGYFCTGDLARRGEDGVFTIEGRLSTDVIKFRGFKVSALEIERVLTAHPSVAEVAVAGVPHAEDGETIVAWVELRAAHVWDEDALRAHASSELGRHKVPMRWIQVASFPRVGPGKIDKKALRASLSAALGH